MCAMLTVYAENGGRDSRRAIDFALPGSVKLVSFYVHYASIDLRHYTPAIAHIAHKLCELLISCTLDCQLGRGFCDLRRKQISLSLSLPLSLRTSWSVGGIRVTRAES